LFEAAPRIAYTITQANPDPTPGSASDREQLWGWSAGVGGEWAFKDNSSFGLEYRHTDLSSHGYTPVSPTSA
jgi:opacity protein-like surface antigen